MVQAAGLEPAWSLIKSQVHPPFCHACPGKHDLMNMRWWTWEESNPRSRTYKVRAAYLIQQLHVLDLGPRPILEIGLPPYESGRIPDCAALARAARLELASPGLESGSLALSLRPHKFVSVVRTSADRDQ